MRMRRTLFALIDIEPEVHVQSRCYITLAVIESRSLPSLLLYDYAASTLASGDCSSLSR